MRMALRRTHSAPVIVPPANGPMQRGSRQTNSVLNAPQADFLERGAFNRETCAPCVLQGLGPIRCLLRTIQLAFHVSLEDTQAPLETRRAPTARLVQQVILKVKFLARGVASAFQVNMETKLAFQRVRNATRASSVMSVATVNYAPTVKLAALRLSGPQFAHHARLAEPEAPATAV